MKSGVLHSGKDEKGMTENYARMRETARRKG